MMRCADFRQWLDEGRYAPQLREATDHRLSCIDCEREHRAAMELEALLATPIAVDPDGNFTDGVFAAIDERPAREAPLILQLLASPGVTVSIAIEGVLLFERHAFTAALAHVNLSTPLSAALAAAVAAGVALVSLGAFQVANTAAG